MEQGLPWQLDRLYKWILWQTESIHFPYLLKLCEKNYIKQGELIHLAVEISKQLNIQAEASILLAPFRYIYSKKQEQKAKVKSLQFYQKESTCKVGAMRNMVAEISIKNKAGNFYKENRKHGLWACHESKGHHPLQADRYNNFIWKDSPEISLCRILPKKLVCQDSFHSAQPSRHRDHCIHIPRRSGSCSACQYSLTLSTCY